MRERLLVVGLSGVAWGRGKTVFQLAQVPVPALPFTVYDWVEYHSWDLPFLQNRLYQPRN